MAKKAHVAKTAEVAVKKNPVLEKYTNQNPHKLGWNDFASLEASMEFVNRVDTEFTPQELAAIQKFGRMVQDYRPITGWKKPIELWLKRHDLFRGKDPVGQNDKTPELYNPFA